MNKRIVSLFLSIVLFALLAGCGSSTGDQSIGTKVNSSNKNSASAPSGTPYDTGLFKGISDLFAGHIA